MSQSAKYKAYVQNCKDKGKTPLEFGAWNWRVRNLAKARAARGTTQASSTSAQAIVRKQARKPKKTVAQAVGEFQRENGRVTHRVDLMGEKNGLSCMVVDRTDLKSAMRALNGYGVRHGKGEGYTSRRGEREKLYVTGNLPNARKALIGAGLQPTF